MKKKILTRTNVCQARATGVEGVGPMDTWKLIQKTWHRKEGWMKSTKAMQIPGVGCVVQVTTQHKDQVAEALCFVPNVKLQPNSKNTWTFVPFPFKYGSAPLSRG